jgi:glycosyltransferase involved in cell wall biosynthesis
MHCLWFTLADPFPPTNGQFLYSGGLIAALSSAGANIDVVGLARVEGKHSNGKRHGSVCWWLVDCKERTAVDSVISPLPQMAARLDTCAMRRMVEEVLYKDRPFEWDAIIFDSLSAAFALSAVLARYPNSSSRPLLIYIAQNHEADLARQIARVQPHGVKRQFQRIDAYKVACLERQLLRTCDLVTADSPEDCFALSELAPHAKIELLLPAYMGRRVAARQIGRSTPRRVIMVGSLEWLPKRINIEEFVAAADNVFEAAGIELVIVGDGQAAHLNKLRRKVKATKFTGRVEDVSPYLAEARLGVVAERVGGGFKMKVLDYIFHRVPMLILAGTAPGLNLRHDRSFIACHSHEELASAAVRMIDDLPLLNRLQEAAFDTCEKGYELGDRGHKLVGWISNLQASARRPPTAGFSVEVARAMRAYGLEPLHGG